MRKYETIIVVNPTFGEAELKEEIGKLQKILEGHGAKNLSVETWGKKEIAYLVHKQRYGHYLCVKFEADDHTAVEQITGILRITESVIKFQTHRIEEKSRKFKGNPKKLVAGAGDEFAAGDSDF